MTAKSKIEKATKAINLGMQIYGHAKGLHRWYTTRDQYFATVEEDAFAYPELMAWLNERVTGKNYRFLIEREETLRYLDAKESIPVYIDGHKLLVSMGQDSTADPLGTAMMGNAQVINRREVLTFTSQGFEGIKALENLLDNLRKEAARQETKTYLYTPSNFGWGSAYMPKRGMDSVFLPEGVKESLVEDVNKFRNSADEYEKIGIPWHRGYLLHGAPGNGKSSMALALANDLKLSLFTLPLSAVSSDRQLTNMISDMRDDSILLIEDIDIFSGSVSRNAQKEAPTLAGMLNTLDGVGTPRGLITFITTNHVDSLDPALIRPGRVDYRLELKAPNDHQIRSMYRYVFGEELDVEPRKFESMADLTNVFKMNLGDAEAVRLEIKA
jgi:hypothetical protein